jgi:hypothetical protein
MAQLHRGSSTFARHCECEGRSGEVGFDVNRSNVCSITDATAKLVTISASD